MDLIRDVLDNQLVDRSQRPLGKVDGIVLEVRETKPPRVAYLEVGGIAPARRLHWPLRSILMALARKWGARHGEPFRIPWSKVRAVGIDVEVDLDVEDTPTRIWEDRIREHIIGRIPGA